MDLSGIQISWFPLLPPWWIVTVGLALVAAFAHGCVVLVRKRVPRGYVVALGLLRVIAIALFLVCLFRPFLSWEEAVTRQPDLLVLFDTSASMGGVEPSAPASRLDGVLDVMRDTGLEARLSSAFNLHRFSFDQDARPLDRREVEHLNPQGETTALGRSLSTAVSYYRQAFTDTGLNPHPAQVLLVTDGNDLGVEDAVETARRSGLVVHVLTPEDPPAPNAGPRIEVAGIQGPRRVLLGAECRIRATVRQEEADDAPVVLELTEDDRVVVTHTFSFKGEAERQISLSYRPTTLGAKRYSLRVAPPEGGEPLRNARPSEMVVNVVGRKHKVLYLEDSWRWEFKFLRRVLEDDPNFSFTAFLQRGPGIYMQFVEPDSTVKLSGFPQSSTELEWFDMIILGDVNPKLWPPALAPALEQLVIEKGRSLVVIAGPNTPRLIETPRLEALLPVEMDQEASAPVPGPIHVRPSRDGAESPLFYSPGQSAAGWKGLPPMDQVYAPLRKRPAATILLEVPDRANVFGNLIVMAEHTVGRGRVLYVGTDTLWKWQTLATADESGNTPYTVFWQQALRALAPGQWGSGSVDLWVQTDRSRYVRGETVNVTTFLEGEQTLEDPEVNVTVTLPDGQELPLSLSPDAARGGARLSEFEASLPGMYKISASVRSEGKVMTEIRTAVHAEAPLGELTQLRANDELLDRLMLVTGGHRIDPRLEKTWPSAGQQDGVEMKHTRTLDLWNSLLLLIALVAVLGLDWLVRLLRGFV